MYKFETVIGSQTEKPKEIDTTSSRYVVYIRKDIEEYTSSDEGIEFKGWKYKECVVPNNEYLVESLKENKETNETIMLAIADLYESQLSL